MRLAKSIPLPIDNSLSDLDNPCVLSMESIIVQPPPLDVVVNPLLWFDSPGPFELEIGCGKGGFLVSRAMARPDVRLLGIEWANKYYRFAADRMARRGLSNVRLMRTDARVFVLRNLPPECVDILHLYHPDPWPKKRHHKRRLVQSDFVSGVVRILKAGGFWLIQSDHAEYFNQMRELIYSAPEFIPVEWTKALPDVDAGWQGTNYEIKYSREGRPIFRAAFQKQAVVAQGDYV